MEASSRTFRLIVALPPGIEDLGLLEASGERASSLVDLRFGNSAANARLIASLHTAALAELYVFCPDPQTLESVAATLPADTRLIVPRSACWPATECLQRLHRRGYSVGFEVFDEHDAEQALACGARFLVASGHEAYGPVSEQTSLVLLQSLLRRSCLPVIARGSLGPRATASAFAAGAAGAVLDSPLLLARESGLAATARRAVAGMRCTDTVVLGRALAQPIRLRGMPGMPALARLQTLEAEAEACGDATALRAAVLEALRPGFAAEGPLFPVGQGVAFASRLAGHEPPVRALIEHYERAIVETTEALRARYPFREGAPLAHAVGTRLPVVQGPLSNISDRPAFADAVERAGGLPFLALGAMRPADARALVEETAALMQGRSFGAGLIGYETMPHRAAHEALMLELKPPFVTLAGGQPEQVARLEAAGVRTWLHAPTPSHVSSFVRQGVLRLILEGHEAGGHIGAVGSLILWELACLELIEASETGLPVEGVLFAGGIATPEAALMAGALGVALEQRGIPCGIQMGTAYLFADETVASGAVSSVYAEVLRGCARTTVFGEGIHLPTRCAATAFPDQLRKLERELSTAGALSLLERKQAIETANAGHLRIAAKAIKRNPAFSKDPRVPHYLSVEAQEQVREGAYHAGQVIALLDAGGSIRELHDWVSVRAAALASGLPQPDFGHAPHAGVAVAIVGMGCMVPGAKSAEEFWRCIIEKRSQIREVPPHRWDPKIYYNPDRSDRWRSYTKIGSFLDEDPRVDSQDFRMPPSMAEVIDPIQHLALEVAARALADAGCQAADLPKERTAVVVGNSQGGVWSTFLQMRASLPMILDSLAAVPAFQELSQEAREAVGRGLEDELARRLPAVSQDSFIGQLASVIAGRIGNTFDIQGECLVVDGACGSGLAALSIAVDALLQEKYDVVLTGAFDLKTDPAMYLGCCSLGALSEKGSFPFDARADGFVLGEGGGMLVLKRLADAQRDGDRIYAVVQGVGASSDGRGRGLMAPRSEGQVLAMQRAYGQAGISPASVGLVEAHGTGTVVGDRTELQSLHAVFEPSGAAPQSCGLGSVKSQIGHLKAAAGMAGLIKAALALHHQTLPPTINCETPTPNVDWQQSPFFLVDSARPWQTKGSPRRAGVNAFGFGGVNYHAVLEEAPRGGVPAAVLPAHLFLIGGASREQVLASARALRVEMGAEPQPDALFARSLALWRQLEPGDRILAVVAGSASELSSALERALEALADPERRVLRLARGIYYDETADGTEPLALLCPGQGSQYAGMGRELAAHFPAARQVFELADRRQLCARGERLTDLLWQEGVETQLAQTDNTHPSVVATVMAVARVLRLAGVTPDFVAGHSLGEYPALAVAGVFDLDTLFALASFRGSELQAEAGDRGAMAGVNAGWDAVEAVLAELPGYVVPTNRNSPNLTTISGEPEAVAAALDSFEAAGMMARRLAVNVAFHSKLVAPVAARIREAGQRVGVRRPRYPVQSNLLGDFYPEGAAFDQRFWQLLADHTTSAVLFENNVRSLYAAGCRTFVEVGPGSSLCAFVDDTLLDAPHASVPTMVRRGSEVGQLLKALGLLASRGRVPDLERLFQHRLPRKPRRRKTSTPAAPPTLAVAQETLLPAELADAPADMRAAYLNERRAFLSDLIRLDFSHHKPASGAPAADAPSATGRARQVVLDAIETRSGYGRELLQDDLNLEADLGIDSIRQTEIRAEILEQTGLAVGRLQASPDRLTVADWIRDLEAALSAEDAEAPVPELACKLAEPCATPVATTDCSRFVPVVRDAPLQQASSADLRGHAIWLLPGNDSELSGRLTDLLETAGAQVRLQDVEAEFPEHESPERLLDLRGLDADRIDALIDPAAWWQEAEGLALQSFELARRLAALFPSSGPGCAIIVATALGGRLLPDGLAGNAGLMLGVHRALRRECASNTLRVVDFEPRSSAETRAARLFDELCQPSCDAELGYLAERRVRLLAQQAPLPSAPALPLDGASVVLAVGGGRGVTALLAEGLALPGGPTVYVSGRAAAEDPQTVPEIPEQGLETLRAELIERARQRGERVVPTAIDAQAWRELYRRERAAMLRRVRSAGGKMHYLTLDVLEAASLQAAVDPIQARHGRLDLVLHGAASLLEKGLGDTTPEDFLAVVKVRALGTAQLLKALHGSGTRLMNLGTIAARLGGAGLAAYAAGHQAAAHLVQAFGGAGGCNLILGPWLDLGMTRRGPSAERFRAAGIDFLTAARGLELVRREIASGAALEVSYRGRIPGLDLPPHSLLDSIEIDGTCARGRRLLDPDRDAWIEDHRIGGLAFFPGLFGLELMAATALPLLPGSQLQAFHSISFERPIRFIAGRAVALEAELTALPGGSTKGARFQGVLRSADGVHFRTVVELACETPDPGAVEVWDAGEGADIALASLYDHPQHDGRRGAFATHVRLDSLEADGVSGIVAGTDPVGLGPLLMGNGVLLDGALSLVDVWELERGERLNGVPVACEELRVFPPGTVVSRGRALVRICESNPEECCYDTLLLDPQGRPLMAARGVRRRKVAETPSSQALRARLQASLAGRTATS